MHASIKKPALYVLVCLIWGTTWMAMSFVVSSIPPITATGLRFLLSAPVLFLAARVSGQPIRFPREKRGVFAILALLYYAIPFTLMIYSEKYASPGMVSIIFGAMPVFIVLINVLFKTERPKAHQAAGTALAFGALTAIIASNMDCSHGDWRGIALAVAGATMHAFIYARIQVKHRDLGIFTFSALPSAVAALLLLIVGYVAEHPVPSSFQLSSIAAVGYLALVANVGGIVAYFALNRLSTPFQASSCFLIFPVIAFTLDWLISDISLSPASFGFFALLCVGIVLTKAENLDWIRRALPAYPQSNSR